MFKLADLMEEHRGSFYFFRRGTYKFSARFLCMLRYKMIKVYHANILEKIRKNFNFFKYLQKNLQQWRLLIVEQFIH